MQEHQSMRTIIGLAALARSGKDTVASMLLSYPDVAAFALADPLKVGCQALFGLTDKETWCDDLKEQKVDLWGRSPREFFQTVGTEWMRNHNSDHWLMRADREINPRTVPTAFEIKGTSNPSLGTPIVLAAQAFFDFSLEQLTNPEQSKIQDLTWGLSPIEAIELLRSHTYAMYPDFDRRRALRPIEPLKPRGQIPRQATTIIVKDIRFENEAAFLRAHQGKIWHITRPDLQKVNAHSSEHGIARAPDDVLILNEGSLKDLKARVEDAWHSHLTEQKQSGNRGDVGRSQ
jgi:hypothetical protein